MDTIINYEREKVDSLYHNLENLLIVLGQNASKIKGEDTINNLIDKIRLLNRTIDDLNIDAMDLLVDLKHLNCELDEHLSRRLEEEENTNRMVRDLTPLMLLYTISQTPRNINSDNV